MKEPRKIEVIQESATYKVPTYVVTDNGIVDGEGAVIQFCKGNINDSNAFRQEGVFTESLLEAAVQYLQSVNVGELANRETSASITNIQQAIFWLQERARIRKEKGVQGTYKGIQDTHNK